MSKAKRFNLRKQKDSFLQKLELPTDSVCGDLVITITGSRSVYIENYRGILQYTKDCLILKGKTLSVRLCGAEIHIAYYTEESMKVMGLIRSVELGCFQDF